jgi:hypothetical protein
MGGSTWGGTGRSRERANSIAEYQAKKEAAVRAETARIATEAEAKRVAEAKAAADAKVAKDAADKQAWDLKLGKGKKKRAGGSVRTDYHTGLGETEQADIASKSLLGM